jgi:glycosyltransferase involved in cell wall biosynthesis
MRGGERVLEIFCKLYPDADIYTLFYNPKKISEVINSMEVRTSFLQNFPFSLKWYRKYLTLFPLAVEQFDLREYDLVISSSHCAAKGVLTTPDCLHICYCYTPFRYGWDMYQEYFGEGKLGCPGKVIVLPVMNYLRLWDCLSSNRVDYFIAISDNVAKRIEKHYRREAVVIHPPVDTSLFTPGGEQGDFFLVVSAFVPYKRVDILVHAFNELGLPLKIVGRGPLKKRIQREAKSNTEFLEDVSDSELLKLYQRCRALVFAGIEDFGLAPLEVQSAGRPVIAYGKGGLLETVVEGRTGIFFREQTPEAVIGAVKKFQEMSFEEKTIREHAIQFGIEDFKKKFQGYVEERCREWIQERRGVFSL